MHDTTQLDLYSVSAVTFIISIVAIATFLEGNSSVIGVATRLY